MAEPTIICPKCKNEIKLNESLAAPLIESTRRDYEQRLAQKELDIAVSPHPARRDCGQHHPRLVRRAVWGELGYA
jgi:hypothetical protein